MKKKLERAVLIVGTGLLFASTGCSYEPRVDEPCSTENEQRCSGDNTIYQCTDGRWVKNGQTDDYTCMCIEVDWNGCAVPGFVGIAEAEQARDGAPHMRSRHVGAMPILI